METNKNIDGHTFKFKTNINCSGCVAKVTRVLNNADGVHHWHVDTSNKDKILTVHSDGITEKEIIKAVQGAGFTIKAIYS